MLGVTGILGRLSTTAAITTMSLAAEDIRFIKTHIGEWLAEQSLGKPPAIYEVELRERMVRIEEELKHQRELIKTILEQIDKRFEAVQNEMNRRFETMQQEMNRRFEAMQQEMNRRFEAVDKRFEAVDKRFEAADKRFEALTRRIDRLMIWSLATTVSVGGLVVTALKLLL